MRGHHTFYDRLFEGRSAYGIPISNLIIVSAILFSCGRSLFFRAIHPLACKLITPPSTKLQENAEDKILIDRLTTKAKKYILHSIWFIVMVSWAAYLAYNSNWGFRLFYELGYTMDLMARYSYGMELVQSADGTYSVKELDLDGDWWIQNYTFYACIQIGWYCHCFLEDTIWDRKRGDYVMMVAHHIITILLVLMTIQGNFEYHGFMVLLPMDAMDLILYAGKMFHLFSNTIHGLPKSRKFAFGQMWAMFIISISWAYTRLYMYGCCITSWTLVYFFQKTNVFTVTAPGETISFFIYEMTFFGFPLLIFQCIWAFFIWKMTLGLFSSGVLKEGMFNTYADSKKKEDSKLQ